MLGGPAAEGLVLEHDLRPPTLRSLNNFVTEHSLGHTPNMKCQDHFDALEFLLEQDPPWNTKEMATALSASHTRCCTVINGQRSSLAQVADALAAAIGSDVSGKVIDDILEKYWVVDDTSAPSASEPQE